MRAKFNQMCVREAMITLAGKPGYGEQPRWLGKIADAANISRRTARSLWRGEISNPDHRAVRSIRRAIEAKANEEAHTLADKYRKIIAGLERIDPDFHGAHIVALLNALRDMGHEDRT